MPAVADAEIVEAAQNCLKLDTQYSSLMEKESWIEKCKNGKKNSLKGTETAEFYSEFIKFNQNQKFFFVEIKIVFRLLTVFCLPSEASF